MSEQALQSSDLRQAHDVNGRGHGANHRHAELDQVCQQHALEATQCAVDQSHAGSDDHGLERAPAKHDRADLDRGQRHGRPDQDVE